MHPEAEAAVSWLAGRVVEIGAGGNPTPGVDLIVDRTPRGSRGTAGSERGVVSAADVAADMRHLPLRSNAFDVLVARHLLEHTADTLGVLREWRRVAERLVIVCPDQGTYPYSTIDLDPTHRACFTVEQLSVLCWYAELTPIYVGVAVPQWSFILVAQRESA